MAAGFFRPLDELQARRGEDVAKARFFPFARIVEAVEVEVPDIQDGESQCGQGIGLDHGVGRAFDAAFDAERMQKVAHEGGFARAEIAAQFDQRIGHGGPGGEPARKRCRSGLVGPCNAFYNQRVLLNSHRSDYQLVDQIQHWARELGFSQIGVAGVDLSSAEAGLSAWLAAGFHGDMHYMAAHGMKRARPAELMPGTVSVITARMDYLPGLPSPHADMPDSADWQASELARLDRPSEAVVSVYARGRDYHKVMRSRLQKLAERIAAAVEGMGHHAFTDSAPVLEAELAARSGQGWRGKHTLLLNRDGGSMFFLGEIYVDLALPPSEPVAPHCGTCSACIDICPTRAIVAPYKLDARRCISYLTIEHAGPIPLELRPLMGNRIYGCDDCQLVCPWNKFARRSALPDFDEREGLSGQQLVSLFAWTEEEFLRFTEGSAIRRIGHERWLRNIAVAIGNALRVLDPIVAKPLREALQLRATASSSLVREHVDWALSQTPG